MIRTVLAGKRGEIIESVGYAGNEGIVIMFQSGKYAYITREGLGVTDSSKGAMSPCAISVLHTMAIESADKERRRALYLELQREFGEGFLDERASPNRPPDGQGG